MTIGIVALEHDVQDRIGRVQSMMREKDLQAVILGGLGAPDGFGAIRYLSNLRMWSGGALLILGDQDALPWVAISSPYQGIWSQAELAIPAERLDSPDNLEPWACARLASVAGPGSRIGWVDAGIGWPKHALAAIQRRLVGYEWEDVTESFESIRRIKSAFEIATFQEHGELLDAAMDRFEEQLAPGERYSEICAQTEALVRSAGSFWGRCKLSLDGSPYTVPPSVDRRVRKSDIINFELVYESRWGNWLEMTSVFSFAPLPALQANLLSAYLDAADRASEIVQPGTQFSEISEITDHTIEAAGFPVVGKHTPDCHAIGLDGVEGQNSITAPDRVLEDGMVLSLHPGSIVEGNRGFLISDNFLVSKQGGVRLSPHRRDRSLRVLAEK